MPIEPLQRGDGDLSLIYLAAKRVLYSAQVDDPWFSAHSYVGDITTPQGSYPGYLADETAAPLACIEQYQTCVPSKPASSRCSALGGSLDSVYAQNLTDPTYNLTQWITAAASGSFSFSDVVSSLGDESLRAKRSLKNSVQAPLPSNQWQLEVERWFEIFMASVQGSAIEAAMGPSAEVMRQFYLPPQEEVGRYFCKNQKIRSADHANFSVVGLSTTILIGFLIILLNWSIEWIYVKLLWRFPRFNQYARMEWTVNGTLQLQRLAHEELGYGTWRDCDKEVPIPIVGHEELAVLDLEDKKYPRLKGKGVRDFEMKMGSVRGLEMEQESGRGSPESETESQDWFKGLKRWDTDETLTGLDLDIEEEKEGREVSSSRLDRDMR